MKSKKALSLLIITVLILIFVSCNKKLDSTSSSSNTLNSDKSYQSELDAINSGLDGSGTTTEISSSKLQSSSSPSASSSKSSSASSSTSSSTVIEESGIYSLDAYLSPYWKGNLMYNETVQLLKGQDGTISGKLFYMPDKVKAVRNSALNVLYKEGTDYIIERDIIKLTANSSIGYLTDDDIYEDASGAQAFKVTDSTRFLKLYPKNKKSYYESCIVITYTHKDTGISGFTPPVYNESKLPKTIAKLKSGGAFKIVAFGDSITVGANSSGFDKIAPNMQGYAGLVQQMLAKKYPKAAISLTNTSQGGKASNWGKDNAEALVASHNPDFVIISFGMGDAHAVNQFSPDMLKENINSIMNTVLAKNPNCEFIIATSMNANPVVTGFAGIQDQYPAALITLEKPGVAVADVNKAHGIILNKKGFLSIGANCVNHPNDFIYRLYAQTVLALLVQDY